MIERDTPLPYTVTKTYSNSSDHTSVVTIKVYEGCRYKASDNNHLTTVHVCVEKMMARQSKVVVTFTLDVNGNIAPISQRPEI